MRIQVALVLAALSPTTRLAAQAPSTGSVGNSRLAGTVADTLGQPIALARVREPRSGLGTTTDSLGRFTILRLAPGPTIVSVRRLGYLPADFQLMLPEDSVLVVTIQLTPARLTMDSIDVVALQPWTGLDVSGFWDRMRDRLRGAGSSTFITPEDIERRRPEHTSDLLSQASGVNMRHERGAAIPFGRGQCLMNIWVDGHYLNPVLYRGSALSPTGAGKFGQMSNPITLNQPGVGLDSFVGPHEAAAIEVYPPPSEVPPQFDTIENRCGTIVIWTK